METPLEEQFLFVKGKPILSLAEFQRYAYGLPEEAVAPETLTRWAGGEEVEPSQLLRCLWGEATEAAASSDSSLEVVRSALERLESMFPEVSRHRTPLGRATDGR
jgi:hypothetical protein